MTHCSRSLRPREWCSIRQIRTCFEKSLATAASIRSGKASLATRRGFYSRKPLVNLLELEPNLANEILPGDNDELKEVAASGGLKSLELMFQFLVEATASLIVLIEVVVLGAGVVSRYVFHKPITWTDELATTLFLWLAMFGSVIALQRGEHMRLTAVANMVPPRWRGRLDALSSVSTILFLGFIVFISREHVEDH